MKLSKNGVGFIVLVLSTIGVTVAESDLITTIATLGQIASGVLMFINQFKREDVKSFVFKK